MNYKDIQLLYQTTLRNIGLFTSISLALLGVSRFYRGKNHQHLNIGYILLSIVFTIMTIILDIHLIYDHSIITNMVNEKGKHLLDKWYSVPKILLITNSSILLFTLYTLYRQF